MVRKSSPSKSLFNQSNQILSSSSLRNPQTNRKSEESQISQISWQLNRKSLPWFTRRFCSKKERRRYRDMAVASEETTNICSHCDRAIPSLNIDLHFAHCSRNLEKCKICGDMVPKKHAEEHFLNTHAPVACSLCSETMEREILAIHKGENCPQRIVTCEFCEFPLPAIDLAEHQEVCGNRTELCHLCNRYIRLRERYNHEARCTGVSDITAGSSRDVRAAERAPGAPRTQPHDYSRRRLLFTIAITGIAVLLGSILFQRKTGNNQVH